MRVSDLPFWLPTSLGCVCFATGDVRCGGQSTLIERLEYLIRLPAAQKGSAGFLE